MNPSQCTGDLLRTLASMPFSDRLDLAAQSGWSRGAVYEAIRELEGADLVTSVSHGTGLIRPTRRYRLTADGLRLLASLQGTTVEAMLRSGPVSARWQRLLMERLDSVAVIYRLAAFVSNLAHPVRFRWYRAQPMDACLVLPDGRVLVVVRHGPTVGRTAFAKRMWRLGEGPQPSAVLVLLPDEVRLLHARKLLTGSPVPAFLALEEEVTRAGGSGRVWHVPSVNSLIDLRRLLSHADGGGVLPHEPPLSRARMPDDDPAPGAAGTQSPIHLLPALLKPAEKRTLDLLSDWPWITPYDLSLLQGVSMPRLSELLVRIQGLGLSAHVVVDGQRRLALTDRGLTLLARRDRTSVGLARRRWSVTTARGAPLT